MNKETAGRGHKSQTIQRAARKQGDTAVVAIESMLPAGSWQRVAVGVAAAAGGGLLAAAAVGVGPAAIAGAAGYLAYRGLHEVGHNGHKH